MSTQVMVTLPDEVYYRAERLAQLTSRDVAEILAETVEFSLLPLGPRPEPVRPVTELLDGEVLALIELQMEPAQDRRLSTLLDRQQAGELTEAECRELPALIQVYQDSLLRKAQALREAVHRGLREPLEP